ncbi:EpsG family protein [Photobacterium damselae]|uniref:EpsG family protein n=1 Tax=Photobacterium damselae subsp. damselae TaxID=85581 RepID=A0AAD3WTU4_PHODD|nr:EpsG family protein [Photobacterium damselae]AWK81303.1 hypothetical protein BST98_04120 [Photobacterium damselae]KAB1177926.1 hypothetical protein F6450_16585 [Photobacterium damselae subsp. damselae]
MYILSILNIFFPFIFVFPIVIIYLFSNLDNNSRYIVFANVIISIAFFGFNFERVGETGDVFRYATSLALYSQDVHLNGRGIIENIYELYYPIWYFLFYVMSTLDLNINYLNMLAGITIYGSIFYIINGLKNTYSYGNVDKYLFVFSFLFVSIISIYTSYKTMWAFSFVLIGIYQLCFLKKNKGYLFFFIGIGIHPIAWIPFLSYFLSKYIKISRFVVILSLFFGCFLNYANKLFYFLKDFPFIGDKINFYIFGDWGKYRFQDNSEYILFYLLIVLVLFILLSLLSNSYQLQDCNAFSRYNDFIMLFMAMSFLLISYRTFSIRLIVTGCIFYYPYIYQVLIVINRRSRSFVTVSLFVLFCLMIDPRTFNINNVGYIVGDTFPFNVFYSPLLSLFFN